MKDSTLSLLLLFFCVTFSGYSQNKENKWAIDIGSSLAIFNEDAGNAIGYRYVLNPIPKVGLTKYLFKDVSIAGAAAYSISETRKYITLDGELRYGFGTTEKKIFGLASIYSIIGASYLIEPKSITLNFGGGGIIWISERLGLTSRLLYKYFGVEEFPRSHIYASGGFVYQFSLGNNTGSSKPKGGSRSRIWDY